MTVLMKVWGLKIQSDERKRKSYRLIENFAFGMFRVNVDSFLSTRLLCVLRKEGEGIDLGRNLRYHCVIGSA